MKIEISLPYPSLIKIFFILSIQLIYTTTPLAFEGKNIYKTKYADIHYSHGKDLNNFKRRIKSTRLFSFLKKKDNFSLKNRLDELVEKVEAILEMYPPQLNFHIILYVTNKEVAKKFKNLSIFGKPPISFYFHKTKAIYLSVDLITDRILAHEIAHVLINNFFVDIPPRKMQEILAQYVDLHLWED